MSPLLLSAALVLSVEFKKMLDTKPNTPIISLNSVKTWVLKGAGMDI